MRDFNGAGLKKGDSVVVNFDFGQRQAVAIIIHATPTQLHAAGRKFSRDHGGELGGSKWNSYAERAARVGGLYFPVGAGTMADVKEYVHSVYTDSYFQAQWPHAVPPERLVLHNGGGTRRAAAGWDYWMRFPRFTRNKVMVLHEIAHLLCHNARHQHSAHGRQFCSTLLELVRHFMGFDSFLALRQAMIERNVKFLP